MLKEKTKNKLFEAWAYCDEMDKSTEYTLQYMQDFANVRLDTVLNFIYKEGRNRDIWYKNNSEWYKKYNFYERIKKN